MKRSPLVNLTYIGYFLIIILLAFFLKDTLGINSDFVLIFFIIIAFLLIDIVYYYLRRTKLDKFWEQTDFHYKNKYPRVINTYDSEKGENIKVYKVKMPVGMCKSDFVAKREQLEQYLNAQVNIEYNDCLLITIDRNKKPLP